MINLYSTPADIKAHLGDGMSQAVEKYDAIFIRLIGVVSRLIDQLTGRIFFPYYDTRYYEGSGNTRLWIDDLMNLESLHYSLDHGLTYTDYQATDYYLTRACNPNTKLAYNLIIGNLSGDYPVFPVGQRSIKAVGWWGYHENRAIAWEQADTLSVACNDTITTLSVADASGKDQFGIFPKFQAGQTLKIDNEVLALTQVDTSESKIKVIRGLNGTLGATHNQNAVVYVWRTPAIASEACTMQTTRSINRAWQGYSDGRATPELAGQILWTKKLDPEVVVLLETIAEKG